MRARLGCIRLTDNRDFLSRARLKNMGEVKNKKLAHPVLRQCASNLKTTTALQQIAKGSRGPTFRTKV